MQLRVFAVAGGPNQPIHAFWEKTIVVAAGVELITMLTTRKLLIL